MASTDEAPRRKGADLKAEMNVTPLVDIVLVLLIIFNPDNGNGSVEPTTVTLTHQGQFYFEKEVLPLDALLSRLTAVHQEKPQSRLVLKADKGLEYGKVRSLFKSCQGLGFPGVSLQVIDRANKAKGGSDGV
jgi:biopolymer transport protein TolR